jgi:2-polyprenyl-6-methoxyphenol hydroxylase-like FAD-dependent oxidoreductase
VRSGTLSRTDPGGDGASVAIVGAGAVGLTLAGRLAQHGVAATLFEAESDPVRIGSRAICMQRETLEIWQRLGIGQEVADRGIQWRVGRTYYRGRELFSVELPTSDEHFPPFVNISQAEVEERLEARARELGVEVRRGHRLIDLVQDTDGVSATLDTADGQIKERFDYLVGADGAHSGVRHAIGIGFAGHTFGDRFLIADVRVRLPFTNERHFHFDPPWNPSRQVLLHPQPDGVWRIDWQVPAETDVDDEQRSARLEARIRAVIGADADYELIWLTGYRFSQRLADAFRRGRVFLAGDAAHVMSPFGARGLNSGVADVENLAWKLAAVLDGAPDALLDSYEAERRPAARENLDATNATMRFLTPHGPMRRAWRNLVLRMAPRSGWFRRRVNSGRLAEPTRYPFDGPEDASLPRHGSVAPDVRLPDGGRLRDRLGRGLVLVVPRRIDAPIPIVAVGEAGVYGPDRAWLARPDGYLAGSVRADDVSGWIGPSVERVRATGRAD